MLLGSASHEPVVREDESVDHHATTSQQFVEESTVIATRTPPIQGREGWDIVGNPKPARALCDQTLDSLAGQNTEVRGDFLVTTSAGRRTERGSRIDVLPVFTVEGTLNYSVRNIDFAGDVTVRGDVKPGFSIKATGSVTVYGMTAHATIHTGGDITLQGAVRKIDADDYGEGVEHEPEIVANGNVTANYLHSIAVELLGEATINREMVNCQLMAGSVRMPLKGRIVGGTTVAKMEVECGTLGSQNA